MLEPVWAARPTAGSRRFTSSSMRLVAGVACVLGSLTLLTLSGDLQLPLSLQALTMEPGRTDADGTQHLGAGVRAFVHVAVHSLCSLSSHFTRALSRLVLKPGS